MPGSGAFDEGSSPLARGPQWLPCSIFSNLGLIPARAGTTRPQRRINPPAGAHPRSRGDHLSPRVTLFWWLGSSPLARGPQRYVVPKGQITGLIPARAGTTDVRSLMPSSCWAHPRSRGDHTRNIHRMITGMGSSPLARGPPVWNGIKGAIDGLIPARAGTTIRAGGVEL